MQVPLAPFNVPALCFHHIADLNYYTAISRRQFLAIVESVSARFTLIGANDIPGLMNGTVRTELPPLLLTLDDGYEDNLDPLLEAAERFGCKGIVFPVANYIGRINDWNAKVPYRARHMSGGQLSSLAAHGYDIGSHTLDHINLVRLDEREKRRQIQDSRALLEDTLQVAINIIAYPYGAFDAAVLDLARDSYRLGFSTASKGGCFDWRDNPHAIRRHSVGQTMDLDTLMRSIGAWQASPLTPALHTDCPVP